MPPYNFRKAFNGKNNQRRLAQVKDVLKTLIKPGAFSELGASSGIPGGASLGSAISEYTGMGRYRRRKAPMRRRATTTRTYKKKSYAKAPTRKYRGKGAYTPAGTYAGYGQYKRKSRHHGAVIEGPLITGSTGGSQANRFTTSMKYTELGGLMVTGKCYVRDIVAGNTGDLTTQTFNVQPGLASAFGTFIASIASNFESYECSQVLYHYDTLIDPNLTSSTYGIALMCSQNVVNEPLLTDKRSFLETAGSLSGRLTQSMVLPVECNRKKIAAQHSHLWVRNFGLYETEQQQDYDLARISIATYGLPSTLFGQVLAELSVSYTIHFISPKPVKLPIRRFVAVCSSDGDSSSSSTITDWVAGAAVTAGQVIAIGTPAVQVPFGTFTKMLSPLGNLNSISSPNTGVCPRNSLDLKIDYVIPLHNGIAQTHSYTEVIGFASTVAARYAVDSAFSQIQQFITPSIAGAGVEGVGCFSITFPPEVSGYFQINFNLKFQETISTAPWQPATTAQNPGPAQPLYCGWRDPVWGKPMTETGAQNGISFVTDMYGLNGDSEEPKGFYCTNPFLRANQQPMAINNTPGTVATHGFPLTGDNTGGASTSGVWLNQPATKPGMSISYVARIRVRPSAYPNRFVIGLTNMFYQGGNGAFMSDASNGHMHSTNTSKLGNAYDTIATVNGVPNVVTSPWYSNSGTKFLYHGSRLQQSQLEVTEIQSQFGFQQQSDKLKFVAMADNSIPIDSGKA